MRKLRSLLVAAALVAGVIAAPFAGQANAEHSACGGSITPAGLEGTVVEVPGGFYLDFRSVAEDENHLFSIWIYQESNGQAGLQRGGQSVILPETGVAITSVDPCVQSSNPDTIIF